MKIGRCNSAVNTYVLGTIEGYDMRGVAVPESVKLGLIYGDSDYLLPEDSAELHSRARAIAHLSDCGHFPFVEAPAQLVSHLQLMLQ